MYVEVTRDFFVPVNLHGNEVFFQEDTINSIDNEPLKNFKIYDRSSSLSSNQLESVQEKARNTASTDGQTSQAIAAEQVDLSHRSSVFSLLGGLKDALMSSDPDQVQNLLEKIDSSISRLVTLRTKVGSIINSVDNAELNLEKNEVIDSTHKSKIEDADVAELFSDLQRHKAIMEATYRSGSKLLKRSLVDFLG